MKKIKASLLTMFSSVFSSVLNIIVSLIYNKLLIKTYGSSINGLIGTLMQFVSFFSVIEGGFTTAAVVALYKPIVEKDEKKISDILFTTKKVYLSIGLTISVLVLAFGSFYIYGLESPLPYSQTFFLLLITLSNTFINISIIAKHSVLFEGLNKAYLTNIFSLISRLSFKIIAILLMLFTKVRITVLYLTTLAELVFNTILVVFYEKTHFPSINYNGTYNKKLIKGTSDIMKQKIAEIVFTSTDLVVISLFVGLTSSSVYNTYMQFFRIIALTLTAILVSPFNSFGQLYKSNGEKEVYKYYKIYKKGGQLLSTTIIGSFAAFCIPFIKIYTKDFVDAQYLDLLLIILFYACFFIQTANSPFGMILNSSGNFKVQNKQSVFSAAANVVISLFLVNIIGIYGVILGSCVGYFIMLAANLVKTYSVIFKNERKKDMLSDIYSLFVSFLLGMVFIIANYSIGFEPVNYFYLIIYGVIITIVFLLINLFALTLIDKDSIIALFSFTLKYLKKISIFKTMQALKGDQNEGALDNER